MRCFLPAAVILLTGLIISCSRSGMDEGVDASTSTDTDFLVSRSSFVGITVTTANASTDFDSFTHKIELDHCTTVREDSDGGYTYFSDEPVEDVGLLVSFDYVGDGDFSDAGDNARKVVVPKAELENIAIEVTGAWDTTRVLYTITPGEDKLLKLEIPGVFDKDKQQLSVAYSVLAADGKTHQIEEVHQFLMEEDVKVTWEEMFGCD